MRYMGMIVIAWLLCSTGCAANHATYVEQLSPIPLEEGQTFTVPQDGWFVSDPVLEEILMDWQGQL